MKMRIITILSVCLTAFVQMQCGAKDVSQNSNNGTGQKSEVNKSAEMKQPKSGIDAPDEQGRTPLMRAAARNDLEAVKTLLAQGANVNGSSGDGYTAVMYAAFYGNSETVEYLLDHGADVNARDKNGLTALIEAAKQNLDAGDVIASYVGTIKALLKKGADVNARDKEGLTALAYAEKYGLRNKAEIVRLLKDAGAKD
jgi:ankyrin repeat protein